VKWLPSTTVPGGVEDSSFRYRRFLDPNRSFGNIYERTAVQHERSIMQIRSLALPTMAFLAGLAGGLTSRVQAPRRADLRLGTLQARRIELIDATGRVTAFIGTDDQQDTAIVFLDHDTRRFVPTVPAFHNTTGLIMTLFVAGMIGLVLVV